jgi:hypothetical protein
LAAFFASRRWDRVYRQGCVEISGTIDFFDKIVVLFGAIEAPLLISEHETWQ